MKCLIYERHQTNDSNNSWDYCSITDKQYCTNLFVFRHFNISGNTSNISGLPVKHKNFCPEH